MCNDQLRNDLVDEATRSLLELEEVPHSQERDTETLRHSDTQTPRHRDTETQRHRDRIGDSNSDSESDSDTKAIAAATKRACARRGIDSKGEKVLVGAQIGPESVTCEKNFEFETCTQ